MKVLFTAMEGHGHLNAIVGIARNFEQAGHSIFIAVKSSMKCLVESFGYHIESFDVEGESSTDDHQKKFSNFIFDNCSLFQDKATQTIGLFRKMLAPMFEYNKMADDKLFEIIKKVLPDLIVYDSFLPFASIMKSRVTYVNVESVNPLLLWPDFSPGIKEEFETLLEPVFNWLREKGVAADLVALGHKSAFLNVYIYPEDLDYVEKGELKGNYFRLDHAVRKETSEPLNVDLSFVNPGDKLVYFSLGSMGAADVELMKRLVSMLAHSKHKFVISKGIFQDQIDLAPNMVGVKYANQIKLLPLVDLVITHGGNNTTVESLYFGKPMIVLPLFGDQPANGARIQEKKLGKMLDPYHVTEEELLNTIDTLLEDEELNQRVAKISEKMRNSTRGLDLVRLIEKELEKKTNNN